MVQGNECILVVDDDASIRALLEKGLSEIGYRCVSVGNPDDADRALEQEPFDLMLLDIGLPVKSGLEFLPEINARYPDMAVVMLTGREELSTAVSAMRAGAYDYVSKPVPLSLLIMRVENAVSRRALLLENKEYRENLERKVEGLNLRLEQSRRELSALNQYFQSRAARGQRISEPQGLLDDQMTALNNGVPILVDQENGQSPIYAAEFREANSPEAPKLMGDRQTNPGGVEETYA